jgi:hypothetical protein
MIHKSSLLAERIGRGEANYTGVRAVFSISWVFFLSAGENRRNGAMTIASTNQTVRLRVATEADAAAIAEIYNQGIEDRVATYETERRSPEDRRAWLCSIAGHYPAIVAEVEGQLVGWAGAVSKAWLPRSGHLRKACETGWPLARRGDRRTSAPGQPDLITMRRWPCI